MNVKPTLSILQYRRPQDEPPSWNFGPHAEYLPYPANLGRPRACRMKTVEFGRLSDTVKEVISLALHRYTRTFVFDPAYYRNGFWDDYRLMLEAAMDEPLDEADLDDNDIDQIEYEYRVGAWAESEYESDSSKSSVDILGLALERERVRRVLRLDLEAGAINEAIAHWHKKMEEQTTNEAEILTALAKLFRGMSCLEKIQVRPWEFSKWPGLRSCNSYEVDSQRGHLGFCSSLMTEFVAQALESAGRHIQHLQIIEFCPAQFHNTPATRHLFTGLRQLSLDQFSMPPLEESQPSGVMAKLLQCALPTLERLSVGAGAKWPEIQGDGEDALFRKTLGMQGEDSPLVFPRLEFVQFRGMIFDGPILLRFLSAQPCLRRLEFTHVVLGPNGLRWPEFLGALPDRIKSCQLLEDFRHEPIEGGDPTGRWDPEVDPIPIHSGWKEKRLYGLGSGHFVRKT
ncbi:hypothetical protein F4824DRAFT_155985 [Ustulina deusta]|nr:hypothetical protein F4824DRAFT_155985 [Ustulina deusta]